MPCFRVGPSNGVLLAAWLALGCGGEFAPTGDGVSESKCNGPGALSDTFEDGELSDAFESRIYAKGLTIEESGGMLVFTPPDSGGSGSRESRYAVDVRGSYAVVEVPEITGGLAGKSVSLAVTKGNTLAITMTANEDTQHPGTDLLRFDVTTDAGNTKSSTPYDPLAQRWWRIGENSGVLSFGASPDGIQWTTHYEVPAPSFIEAGTLVLSTSNSAKVLPVGQIRFDNLNPKAGPFCGIDKLKESFDQDLGEGWVEYQDKACVATLTGGAFDAAVPSGGTGYCSITTRHAYDLRGREFTVGFGSLPAGASGIGVILSLTSGDTDRLTLEHRQGKLTATALLGAATSTGSLDLGGGASWWRIRESAGRVEFEASSDGKSFAPVHSLIVDSLPARFLASLRVYVTSPQPASTSFVVDAIN